MSILNILKKKKLVITHNGGYHADDVFACASISILENGNIKIIRTRDQKLIENGDYVVDVGRVYDPGTNRFDHHQKEGAGKRENGIPYASFGLVWKHFGPKICGSEKAAEKIDRSLVQPIDATDNGTDIIRPIFPNLLPYRINEALASFMPTWQESWGSTERAFFEAFSLAKKILEREITTSKAELEADRQIENAYRNAADKRILILDKHYPASDCLDSFPEVIFLIRPRDDGNSWGLKTVRKNSSSFENKKSLPSAWGGLEGEALQKVTEVPDAIFCHKGLFLAVAKSEEGALRLAQIALES